MVHIVMNDEHKKCPFCNCRFISLEDLEAHKETHRDYEGYEEVAS